MLNLVGFFVFLGAHESYHPEKPAASLLPIPFEWKPKERKTGSSLNLFSLDDVHLLPWKAARRFVYLLPVLSIVSSGCFARSFQPDAWNIYFA